MFGLQDRHYQIAYKNDNNKINNCSTCNSVTTLTTIKNSFIIILIHS